MIDLDPASLDTILAILRKHVHGYEVRVFGSRLKGSATTYSDLDLALVGDGPIDWQEIEKLKDAFAESDLPIMVDVLDWHTISDEFRAVIEKGYEVVRL